jgi:hypothetical protein
VPETMPDEDLTLNAELLEQVTVTYMGFDADKLEYVMDYEIQCYKGKTITLDYFYWNYCNTLGWDANDDGIVDYEYNSEYTVTEDITLKPVLIPFYADVDLGAEDAVFVDAEGNPITRIYAENEYINYVTLTNHPTREGYAFLGWLMDGSECPVCTNEKTGELEVSLSFDSNTVATAMWEANTYNVTYTINGETYKTVPVKYGEAVTAPEYTVPEGYTFSGWTVPETMPAENITLDASLTQNGFIVTWIVDGRTTTEAYTYGSTPSYKGSTDKASEGCTVYTFTGWDQDITAVTGDITYTAQYTQETKHSENGSWMVTRPATPIAEGEKAWICGTCQEPVRTETIPMIQKLAFSGASLTLQDDLTINYKVNQTLFTDVGYENPYVVFVLNGKETCVSEYTLVNGKYVFDFANIIPHQMNDTVYATLYATYNGVEYASATREYSVADYCYNMLGKYSGDEYAKFRTLLVDLLNYGAKSQVFMNYNTGALVNAKLTDAQKAWGTSEMRTLVTSQDTAYKTIDSPSVLWKGAGLNLQKSVGMRFKITASNIENLTVRVTNDLGQQSIITSDTFEATEGGYYVFFDGLNAGQMSEVVYLTVYEGNRAVSHTIRYSIESYAYAKQNGTDVKLAELVVAMMKYGDSAKAYANQ